MLAFAVSLALALGRLRIRGVRQLGTEEDRHAIARDVVRQLREFGDPWEPIAPVEPFCVECRARWPLWRLAHHQRSAETVASRVRLSRIFLQLYLFVGQGYLGCHCQFCQEE
jgi:hypothetical protein